ncbi:hypothetical protein L249_6985 [Ophiocordyceps polyrhachis-furcata BCC 54312]|uniref:AB hydrolase-1 domain-containing protein n=1 Tax=Ophiocordyceps polyrhachis-furcata BCC 54312 TaxID=1330021 RepID=A0A367LLR9_9HYPO|nr:hypothetical protein L249_6985 [Ophiocordyceps polyrhachis-furcata BCC 54312]
MAIPPATLVNSASHLIPGQLIVTELIFEVPLDYANPKGRKIALFARRATKRERPVFPPDPEDDDLPPPKPYMVYLEGGPGFGNREPQDHPLTRVAIARGYQMLYMDYRGVGISTPVSAAMLAGQGDVDAQVSYLRLMRQDNSVRDCEAVRRCLTQGWPAAKASWSIFGQSYGGFVALSYLSMYPSGLREVFLTGGLAPIGQPIENVYEATFARTAYRNRLYFRKFPEDATLLRRLAAYIREQAGAFGFLTRACLQQLETFTLFDTNIIYAILHEAIYCDGPGKPSNWAAYRVGRQKALEPYFAWLNPDCGDVDPVYFAGEMIFPLHFETYPELIALRPVAEKLAAVTDWPRLYDLEQLRDNTVPVYAMSYIDDMYVDNNFARETVNLVKGARVIETNVMYHSALRAKADEVLQALFSLRDDVLD